MESEIATYKILVLGGSDSRLEPYKGLVFSNFLNSLRYGNTWFKAIDSHAYYATYQNMLERMLSRQGCTVRIAVLSDDPDVALGWSISRPNCLDYVFVKRKQRRQGIGRALLPEAFASVSHLTSLGEMLKKIYFPSAKFDPFQ